MPANRSRTTHWRRCLEQISERDGSIEVAVSTTNDRERGLCNLIWRVRVLKLAANEILVEQPSALGRLVPIQPGAELVGIIAVGQNRWMFLTTNLGFIQHGVGPHRTITAMRLLIPDEVERCQRRSHYRVTTASLDLPDVDVWPLLDPKSVVVAERSSELQAQGGKDAAVLKTVDFRDVLPDVGPKFPAKLINLGGGGVGLQVGQEDGQILNRHRVFWLRIRLPELDGSICATAKIAHTHMDSGQQLYAGFCFDFSFNPGHEQFVIEQICRYIGLQQQLQQPPQRRSA